MCKSEHHAHRTLSTNKAGTVNHKVGYGHWDTAARTAKRARTEKQWRTLGILVCTLIGIAMWYGY